MECTLNSDRTWVINGVMVVLFLFLTFDSVFEGTCREDMATEGGGLLSDDKMPLSRKVGGGFPIKLDLISLGVIAVWSILSNSLTLIYQNPCATNLPSAGCEPFLWVSVVDRPRRDDN